MSNSNVDISVAEWEEVTIAFSPSGKAPKHYGPGVFRFGAAMTLAVILPRRNWELIKKSKEYVYLKPPNGEAAPPFTIRIRIPTKDEALEIANKMYDRSESLLFQLGEWPAFYDHKYVLESYRLSSDHKTGQTIKELDHVFPPRSTLTIGQFGIWEITVTKYGEDDFTLHEHGEIVDRSIRTSVAEKLWEGREITVEQTIYERNPKARKRCIEYYGPQCQACGVDFGRMYGRIGEGFIHVHHIVPLAHQGGDYEINPEIDLIPLCPNCHAMVHSADPPITVDTLKGFLAHQRSLFPTG